MICSLFYVHLRTVVWYSGQDLYIRPIHKLNARPRSECWTSGLFGSLPQSYMVTLYIKISKTCYFSFFVKHPINTFPFKQGSHKWRHTNLTQNWFPLCYRKMTVLLTTLYRVSHNWIPPLPSSWVTSFMNDLLSMMVALTMACII